MKRSASEAFEHKLNHIGLVAIGRNEGDRLRQCLISVIGKVNPLVYVDSGSTDDSVKMARSLGVEVVELDLSIPFTAVSKNSSATHIFVLQSPQSSFEREIGKISRDIQLFQQQGSTLGGNFVPGKFLCSLAS